MDRATHSGITQKGRAVRKNLLIGRLNMSMGADNSGHFTVEKSAKRYFFARGFSMNVDNDVRRLAADFRNCCVDSKKRIIQNRLHERASLNVDDTDLSPRGFQNDRAAAGRALWIIYRAQQTR